MKQSLSFPILSVLSLSSVNVFVSLMCGFLYSSQLSFREIFFPWERETCSWYTSKMNQYWFVSLWIKVEWNGEVCLNVQPLSKLFSCSVEVRRWRATITRSRTIRIRTGFSSTTHTSASRVWRPEEPYRPTWRAGKDEYWSGRQVFRAVWKENRKF